MGLEELITSLTREAEDEKKRILDGARAEAAVILAAAERQREGILNEVKRKASGSLDAMKLGAALAARLPEGAIVVDESATSGLAFYLRSAAAPRHTVLEEWLDLQEDRFDLCSLYGRD